MMDELELLKKDWQKKNDQLPKLTYNEIHKMTWKKSSSIVKWILIISILEIILPNLLYLIPSFRKSMSIYDNTIVDQCFVAMTVIYYLVVFYFVFLFYKRYKEISVLDSAKGLMRKIIKTRRTVKYYVIFSLSTILIFIGLVIIGIYLNDSFMDNFSEMAANTKDVSPEKLKTTLMVSMAIIGVVMIAFFGGVYFLLYGLLLRKLKRNYKELKRLEI
ncbi:hypothetical protein Q4603_16460 [Zobellia galactanivorans]|uniref:Conserved hypothetical membrane protein n=1 Tax=Zobellia galactanivorans (strain DSM 12802 / CCUG 47099 / CIP 106680 / NCIMB 13871 / Dsij) TaxID=63186 RepID=G0L1C4_ZOBGA|nr:MULTISPECIES: hypothetical protein [Zobellia]MDO6810220.1 hypothetical protein [Zobellia galactanivorans]OWW23810.1 hypothetical protein B4Q04_18850 [Zobellia sp. OII3]CAZ94604.1 Conserved hypothetical membrane protein [Zobellia galactanivorans]